LCIFLIAALLGVIYALHVQDTLQHVAALVYAGSALGAVFAGDLVTLLIFWEGVAVASAFLIWAARNERALGAGMRYLIVHIGSGVLLLAGVLLHYKQTGSLAFGTLGLGSPGTTLICIVQVSRTPRL
jgi:multicomponent Na+:H+ antiporter subunit D